MQTSPNRVRHGQLGDFWLSKQARSGAWCRTWYDSGTQQTRRCSLGTADIREAQLRLAQWVVSKASERNAPPASVPLPQILVRYYEQHGHRLASAGQAKIALRLWTEYFGDAMVAAVTIDRQEGFIEWLRERGLADGYIDRTLAVGRAAIQRALKRGEISSVPYITSCASQNRLNGVPPKGRALSGSELARLFDSVRTDHLWRFCMLAVNTLARPAAILDLQRDQYDAEFGLIDLNPPGRRQTNKFRPVIPATRSIRPLIEGSERGHLVQVHGHPVRSVRTAFRALRARAELDDSVNPYSFRHTMARALRRAHVPGDQISVMLGHRPKDSVRTTLIYAPYDPAYARDAANAVDAFIEEVRGLSRLGLRQPSS